MQLEKPIKINNKTVSRIAAVQVIYQYEYRHLKPEDPDHEVESLIKNILDFYLDPEINYDLEIKSVRQIKIKPSILYFTNLVKTTITNLKQIDETIKNRLTDEWKIEDLPKLLLALLRVAISELSFFPETPKKVVINEFTNIAGDMLTDNEVGFVNSLLDSL